MLIYQRKWLEIAVSLTQWINGLTNEWFRNEYTKFWQFRLKTEELYILQKSLPDFVTNFSHLEWLNDFTNGTRNPTIALDIARDASNWPVPASTLWIWEY